MQRPIYSFLKPPEMVGLGKARHEKAEDGEEPLLWTAQKHLVWIAISCFVYAALPPPPTKAGKGRGRTLQGEGDSRPAVFTSACHASSLWLLSWH